MQVGASGVALLITARYRDCTVAKASDGRRQARSAVLIIVTRDNMRFTKTAMAFVVLVVLSESSISAQVSFGISSGPPPPPRVVAVAPPRPGPDFEWVEGYWYPTGNHYKWHDGYWTRPPYESARWVEPRHDGERFYEGYWDGDRGRMKHDHHWDRDRDRDFRHDHDKDRDSRRE